MSEAKLTPWRTGDPLAAKHLDEPRRAIESLVESLGGESLPRFASVPHFARFVVSSVAGDYIACYRIDGDGNQATATINIAKPWDLWNSITARGSATYSNTGTDERTATVGGDTEDQVIVPAYVAGDYIIAMTAPSGGTGVSGAELWVDMNLGARAWAKVAA